MTRRTAITLVVAAATTTVAASGAALATRGEWGRRARQRTTPPHVARGWRAAVVLEGLDQPRGLAWLPSGQLCVAEAGHLEGVPVERYYGPGESAPTGRVTCLESGGDRLVVADGLPHTRLTSESDATVGPAALAIRPGDARLYLALGTGYRPPASTILALPPPAAPGGPAPTAAVQVADLHVAVQEFLTIERQPEPAIPVAPRLSNPYAMAAGPDGALYLTDGSANLLLRVWPDHPARAPELIARFPNAVPTGLAAGPDGAWYVASFSGLPHPRGAGAVVRVATNGTSTAVAGTLTLPIGVAFGRDGALYVLEFADRYRLRDDRFAPASGRLLRAATADDARRGTWQAVAERLDFPTAVATGPDGALYVSVGGAYRGRGQGSILRFQQHP